MNLSISKSGVLHIVATPIGNLKDITLRAQEILRNVDVIAAEDTRHSIKLLNVLGINKPLVSLHEHNESSQAVNLIERIKKGESIALISDAGTPLISDPGFKLVDLAHKNNIQVEPVPGPSAVTAAISAAGINPSGYTFIGFLPAKKGQRKSVLNSLKQMKQTLVFFESPHRIMGCLKDLAEVFGEDRQMSFCRELTKQFETIKRGSINQLIQFVETDNNQRRGEIVLVISGATDSTLPDGSLKLEELLLALLEYMPAKTAASLLAKQSGLPRKYFYNLAVAHKKSNS